ncbi:hypothetical protein CJP74_06855 [Psittacicella melopsittaci]|uniref:UvrD-like helicase C-terminal domain-containing protein n=1 Tax=Psittacicella melopsittaci TaxID=2028576 RepID=A0A3A1Y219_9GAMM|nr:AAA family ATPase [Psittacicella melopsittaci]RIY31605.1 hypothetical protein CJP74_06855 [Psittacicella melopsittaci]
MDQIFYTLQQENKPLTQVLYLEARRAYLQRQLEPMYFNALLTVIDLGGKYFSEEKNLSDQETFFLAFLFALLKNQHINANTAISTDFLFQVVELWQKYHHLAQLLGCFVQKYTFERGGELARSFKKVRLGTKVSYACQTNAFAVDVEELQFLVANYLEQIYLQTQDKNKIFALLQEPVADNILAQRYQGQPEVLAFAYKLANYVWLRIFANYATLVSQNQDLAPVLADAKIWYIPEPEELYAQVITSLDEELGLLFPTSGQDTFVGFFLQNLSLHMALIPYAGRLWQEHDFWQQLPHQAQYCHVFASNERLKQGQGLNYFVFQEGEPSLISLAQPYVKESKILDFFIRRFYMGREEKESCSILHKLAQKANLSYAQAQEELLAAMAEFFLPEQREGYELTNQDSSSLVAATQPLSVLIGGPGTGKTTTARKMAFYALGLRLLSQSEPDFSQLQMLLLAPTGKAAAHLGESINHSFAKLQSQEAKIAHLLTRLQEIFPGTNAIFWQKWLEAIFQTGKNAANATLHRALGISPQTPAGKESYLRADLVICDEVGMINLHLFTSLLEAIAPTTKLILLGDKNQLPAIGEGNVLETISHQLALWQGNASGLRAYSQQVQGALAYAKTYGQALEQKQVSQPQISDLIHELNRSFRYKATSLIAAYAEFINRQSQGEHLLFIQEQLKQRREQADVVFYAYEQMFARWGDIFAQYKPLIKLGGAKSDNFFALLSKYPRLERMYLEQALAPSDLFALQGLNITPDFREKMASYSGDARVMQAGEYATFVQNMILRKALQAFSPLLELGEQEVTPEVLGQAFAIIKNNRFLSPVREGELGVDTLNNLMHSNDYFASNTFFPIVISKNQLDLNIANGDLGLVVKQSNGVDYVYFDQKEEQEYKRVPLAFVQQYEKGFFTTIHKSQGDEFDHTCIVLPLKLTDFSISRNILYTAITRAKEKLEIFAPSAYYYENNFVQNQRTSSLLYAWNQYLTEDSSV